VNEKGLNLLASIDGEPKEWNVIGARIVEASELAAAIHLGGCAAWIAELDLGVLTEVGEARTSANFGHLFSGQDS